MSGTRTGSKLNSRAGFSLTELLVAVLILGMVSSVVAGGIPVARDAYNKVTVTANAQVLLSTAITSLRNQLGTASDVKITGTELNYYNSGTGVNSRIYKSSSDPQVIMIQEYLAGGVVKDADKVGKERQLVSDAASNKDLFVTYDSVSRPEGSDLIVFKNISVRKKNETGKSIVSLDELNIRVVKGN